MIPTYDPERTAREIPADMLSCVNDLKDGLIAWMGNVPVVMKGSKRVAQLEPEDLAMPAGAIATLRSVWARY